LVHGFLAFAYWDGGFINKYVYLNYKTLVYIPRKKCWGLGVGGWLLDIGCWWLVVGGWWLDFGCWGLVVGGWTLGVGFWLLGFGWLTIKNPPACAGE
jgi:hypothetical protein